MKKILALVLALGLLCGGVAMADNTTINQDSTSKTASTTVSYTIATNETYTVTIPSSVALNPKQDSTALYGELVIDLSAKSFNVAGKGIEVKLSNAAFKLANGTNEIAYSIQNGNSQVGKGDVVLSWMYSNFSGHQQITGARALLKITTDSIAATQVAGTYSDTLTFNVSVTGGSSENNSNAGGIENQELSDNMNVD